MIAPAYVGLNRDSSDAFAFTRPEFDGQGLLPAFKALEGARARLFRPMYAGPYLGHASRTADLSGADEVSVFRVTLLICLALFEMLFSR